MDRYAADTPIYWEIGRETRACVCFLSSKTLVTVYFSRAFIQCVLTTDVESVSGVSGPEDPEWRGH